MATFDYNPLTGELDLVGSGGASYIDGVVADPTALPVTLGTPALDSVFLAKAGSGVWLINRRPSGLYVRVANNGNLNDWLALGAFPEVNSSTNWELYDGTDPTKELKFDLSGITTGTTRTLTVPNASGRIQVEGQPIGNTTPAAGTFTTLAANNGTITASAPVLDLSQTWNNAAVTFTGLRFNVTNTASAAASPLIDLQVGGVSRMRMTRGGTLHLSEHSNSGLYSPAPVWTGSTAGLLAATNLAVGSSLDLIIERDAADTLAQRRTTNPQTFRLYNTFTDASNYERAKIAWSSNVLQIGTEKGGTGSARGLQFQTDGATRMEIVSGGRVQIPHGSVTLPLTSDANAGLLIKSNRSTGWPSLAVLTDSNVANDAAEIGFGVSTVDSLSSFNKIRCVLGSAFNINDFAFVLSGVEKFRIRQNDLITFGGTTSSFPALKRSSTALQVRLADDSAFAPLVASEIGIGVTPERPLHIQGSAAFGRMDRQGVNGPAWLMIRMATGTTVSSSWLFGPATGVASVANDDFSIIDYGTSTSGTGGTQRLTIAKSDGQLTVNGNLNLSTKNLVTDTTTGTKIGTGTTQLLGFWNATPAAQPAAVADATDAATVITQLNALLSRLRTIGVIAT